MGAVKGSMNGESSISTAPDRGRRWHRVLAKYEEGTETLRDNPRVSQCFDMMKIGLKMGFAIGGIFGAVSGTYSAVVHKKPIILPTSVAVGAISFGFFLSCGMLVRCEDRSHSDGISQG